MNLRDMIESDITDQLSSIEGVDDVLIRKVTSLTEMRDECLEVLKQRLTKRNIEVLFNAGYGLITGHLEVYIRVNSCEDEYLFMDTITIAHHDGVPEREYITELICGVFPYLILGDEKGDYDRETMISRYEIVSRAKHRSKYEGIVSDVPQSLRDCYCGRPRAFDKSNILRAQAGAFQNATH